MVLVIFLAVDRVGMLDVELGRVCVVELSMSGVCEIGRAHV